LVVKRKREGKNNKKTTKVLKKIIGFEKQKKTTTNELRLR